MDKKIFYCLLLEIGTDYIADVIRDMNIDGPISYDYIQQIADNIVEEVAQYIYGTIDREEWNPDDARLAVWLVLWKKLNIDI